jgi:hypothetical protein
VPCWRGHLLLVPSETGMFVINIREISSWLRVRICEWMETSLKHIEM